MNDSMSFASQRAGLGSFCNVNFYCFYSVSTDYSLYNNQINARALIGPWVIVPVNLRKNRASFELLYKRNRPQVSMGYRLINHLGC